MNNFSCLMSFYKKDNPLFLDEAFKSLKEQSLPANEIILIQDGPITDQLEDTVSKWEKELPIKRVVNSTNLGLGKSLNIGLELCNNNIVARMDADDICHHLRFESQYNFLLDHQNISVVGSWIAEFSINQSTINSYRKLPSDHSELYEFAKKRSPLNHPTVMYKKADILKVGSYSDFRFQQDYLLWGRLLNSGFKISNIPQVLLYMRADSNLFDRRGGNDYFKIEVAVQDEFLTLGFINKYEYLRNLIVRGSVRMVPNFMRKFFYKLFLR